MKESGYIREERRAYGSTCTYSGIWSTDKEYIGMLYRNVPLTQSNESIKNRRQQLMEFEIVEMKHYYAAWLQTCPKDLHYGGPLGIL